MTAASADSVSLTEARVQEAPVIQNLIQLYTHDFSEFWAGTSRGELGPYGKFDAYPLDDYWMRPNWSAWLIWKNAALAGFALINDQAHSGMLTQRNVGEFFIVRKHRGQGTGRSAALALFSRYPGQWEVAVTRKNAAAHRFWRGIIDGAAQAADTCELDSHSDQWNGPILRFEWRASSESGRDL
ncbi:MAG TPA: GNAT family N-acetyltransferase [Steroidobacteraceae bacterium]|jgi:predicted acetyltransferase